MQPKSILRFPTTTIACLVFLFLLASSSQAAGKAGLYDPSLAALDATLFSADNTAEIPSTTPRLDIFKSLADDGNVPFAVTIGPLQPATTSTSSESSTAPIPVAVAALAIVYHLDSTKYPSTAALTLSMEELGWLLRGDKPINMSLGDSGLIVQSSDMTISLPTDDALLDAVYQSGAELSIVDTPFNTNFKTVVRVNPRVRTSSTDTEALNFVADTTDLACLSFSTLIQLAHMRTSVSATTRRNNIKVARVTVIHPKYKLHVVTDPKVPAQSIVSFSSDTFSTTISSSTEPMYPITAPVTLTISPSFACAERASPTAWLEQLTKLLGTAVQEWHLGTLRAFQLNAAISKAIDAMEASCTAATVVPSKGSSAIQDLVTGLSRQHLLDTSSSSSQQQPVFVSYSGGGSGGGLAAIKAGTHPIVGSDSLFSAEEYADYPAVQFVPITSFAVSLAYNLPGIDSLVLPRCVVVGIFKGEVTFWDDAAIRKYNPTALIPHQRIHVWARESRSGTTGIFTAGLRRMDEVCMGGISGATFNQSKTFDPRFANLNLTQSSSGVLAGVAAVPYSIGYSSASSVRQRGLSEAVLVDELGGNEVTSPKDEATLQAAVSDATLDEQKMVLSFKASARAYPFSGVSYLVYESRVSGVDCGRQRAVLEFAKWAIVSEKAATYAGSIDFVALPAETRELVRLKLLKATCDGKHVLEQDPVESSETDKSWVVSVAIVVPVAVVGMIILGLMMVMQGNKGRDNSCAPKDNSQPFTIMFTDIESSTALWARAPLSMGPALDAHNEIIRAAIQRHSCYEVKTIGDAFMVACPSPEVAVSLAMDIQRELFENRWSDEDISALYGELHAEKGWAILSSTVSEKLWNGLRVRIGIAHGEAAAKLDEVSGGYDYFGSTVNMASRVEAAGHGGQIVMTDSVLRNLPAGFMADEKAAVSDLGHVPLKGFDEPVQLYQCLPANLAARSFADLRLDVVDKLESTTGDGASTADIPSDTDSHISLSRSAVYAHHAVHSGGAINTDVQSLTGSMRSGSVFSGGSVSGAHNQEQMLLRLDMVDCLFTPLKDSDRKKFLEKLCQAWRIDVRHKRYNTKGVYDNLARRAFAVSQSRRKAAALSSPSPTTADSRSFHMPESPQAKKLSTSGMQSPTAH